MEYKISIIIPVFNVEDYIKEALESIIRQTIGFEHLEVILVDDGSTDKSGEIMDEYAYRYENFKAIHLLENSGAAGKPRNVGIKEATGEYLMFLDPDDYYNDNTCEILYKGIVNEDVDTAFGTYTIHYPNEKVIIQTGFGSVPEVKFKTIDDHNQFLKFPPSVWTKIFRRNFIVNNNIIFPEGIPGQDLVFVTHALLKSNGILLINKSIANYRIRDGENASISFNRNYKYLKGLIQAYNQVYNICKNSDKEKYFSIVLESNLNFWMKQFILSNLDYPEKKEILESSLFLFKKFKEYMLIPKEKQFIDIIDNIINKNYEYAIILASRTFNLIRNQDKAEKVLKNSDKLKFKKNSTIKSESRNYDISVIIPMYNVENYIEDCLDSIINQTIGIENIEVIVVNDCSTDNSLKIVKKYADEYSSIKIIEHETNQGPGPARNTGLKYITSDYISFIDSDDFISLNTYEICLDKIREYDCDLVIYKYEHFNKKGIKYPETIHQKIFKKKGLIKDIKTTPEIIFATSPADKIYSKRLVPFMNFPTMLYEDNIMSAKILFNSKKIYVTDECTYFYRQREEKDSITQQINKNKCFDLIKINIQLRDLVDDYLEYKDMINWINLHFVHKNILNWMLTWDFSLKERKQIFNKSHTFLKSIIKEDIDKFNSYFPNHKITNQKLILDIINKNYVYLFLKYELINLLKANLKGTKSNNSKLENQLSSLNKLTQEIEDLVSTNEKNEKEIKKLNSQINNLTQCFYEREYVNNTTRSFIQRLISAFPSLYILLKSKLNIKNAFVNIKGYKLIKKNNMLDMGYYLQNYRDVRNLGMDLILHYMYYGSKEGYKPSPSFDGDRYLKAYTDVKHSKLNPLVHYILYGKPEGRRFFTVDTTSPKVNGIDPVDNAENVSINKVIKITFNEPIKSGSAYNKITLNGGGVVSLPISKSIKGNVLTITPSKPLIQGTRYTLILHSDTITSLKNNSIEPYSSRFIAAN
jgi:glycosyltransferase involved in cell wall biosynthesis